MKKMFSYLSQSCCAYGKRVLLVLCVCVAASTSYAASKKYATLYAGIHDNSPGNGTVYISETNDSENKSSIVSTKGTTCELTMSGENTETYYEFTYTLHSAPNAGYYAAGWTQSSSSIESLSGGVTHEVKLNGTTANVDEDGHVSETWYAVFKPVTVKSAGTVTNISTTDLEGTGTGTVMFNVANADNANDFTASIEASAGFKILETTYADNVVTVTIQYTDQNKHGSKIASTKVTLVSKGDASSKATATIYASSNLTPTFTKPADHDYGTVYIGDAQSSDEALYITTKNKAASQSHTDGATWQATPLGGANPDQFQLVNANPEYGAFVVRYEPTKEGSHTATLSISVTYTDANGTPISSGEAQVVTLTGNAEKPQTSEIIFNPPSVDFGSQVTGFSGNQKVNVSRLYVGDLTYDWGDTNNASVFGYTTAAGSVTITANPTAPGTYNATLTATGNNTLEGSGTTTATLPVSIEVGLQSPILSGGSDLVGTYYLKWTKVPHANNYEIYEVSGGTQTLVTTSTVVTTDDDDTHITHSIPANSSTEKIFIIKVTSAYGGGSYESWSNEVEVSLNTLTQTGSPYYELYTGTNLTNLKSAGFPSKGTVVTRKRVSLENTFDESGNPLFDELYVFGETVSSDNKTTMTAATTTEVNTAVTPCYVFAKTANGYQLTSTIANVNQAAKQLPNTTDRCWTIADGDNKKLYFTGFCPFGSNGSSKDDEGIIYIKGAGGASVDVYLEDCYLYSRQHTPYGNAISKDDSSMPSFDVTVNLAGIFGGAMSDADAAGTASAIVFECTDNANPSNPFLPTIHTIGDNVLYSQMGCCGYANIVGKEERIGQYSASLQVRVTKGTKDSYTTLSFDDKWPTDATNNEAHRRTNGYLRFQKSSENSPSIELGNDNTVLNFNGGQIELQNSMPGAAHYLNTLAICSRQGYALFSGMTLFVGYGLGQDEVGGEVNFNDGTVNAIPIKITKDAYKPYFDLDADGYTTTLRCPQNTYIMGGSHNSDVRACSAVDKTGGSPRDKDGNTLVKLDYQLPGTANIEVDATTGLVIPTSMPNTLTCVGCGENGADTELDLEHYGKQSLSPDADNYIHLWAPGAGRIEYAITSWVLAMTKITAEYTPEGLSIPITVTMGGPETVPNSPTDKVNNLLFVQIDNNIYDLLETYKIPAKVSDEYIVADVKDHDTKLYGNIENTDEYTIHEKLYYVRAINADEWMLFSPPFHISNVYVLETSSETALEESVTTTITTPVEDVDPEERANALALQAEYNMDCSSILANSLNNDISSNLNRPFDTHLNEYKAYAKDINNKRGRDYSADVKKTRIYPFTGSNYDANFFIYKSEDNTWDYDSENSKFITDWQVSQPVTIEIGDVERSVIMEQGGIYALQFPFCPKCEGYDANGYLNPRDFWDYWTGKFIIFEGYGPQTVPGKSVTEYIASIPNENDNTGELRGNPVFADYEVNESRNDILSFYAAVNDEFYDVSEPLKAGDVYLLTKFPEQQSIRGRMKSVDPETGDVIYENSDSNTPTSTPTISNGRSMLVYTIPGGVGIVPVAEQNIAIYDAAGQLINSQYITSEVQIPLPAGIYLICGENEMAKAVVR